MNESLARAKSLDKGVQNLSFNTVYPTEAVRENVGEQE